MINDKIYKWASIIAESGDEPSYNDIMILVKKTGSETDENTMGPDDYEKLSQDEKDEIHKLAKMNIDFKVDDDNLDVKEFDTKAMILDILEKDKDDKKVYVSFVVTDFKNMFHGNWDVRGYRMCDTMSEAKAFVAARIRSLNKIGIDATNFDVIDTSSPEFPGKIKEVDDKAIMLRYRNFDAVKKPMDSTKMKGVQTYFKHGDEVKTPKEWAKELGIDIQLFRKKVADGRLEGYEKVAKKSAEDGNLPPDQGYSKINKDDVMSFVIYTAKHSVPLSAWKNNLADAIEWNGLTPEEQKKYRDNEKKREALKKAEIEARRNLNQWAKEQDKKDRESRKKELDSMTAKDDELDFGGGDSDDEIENTAANDTVHKEKDVDSDMDDETDSEKPTDDNEEDIDNNEDDFTSSSDKDQDFSSDFDDDDDEEGSAYSKSGGYDDDATPEEKKLIRSYVKQLTMGDITIDEVPDEVKYDGFGDLRRQFRKFDNDTYSNLRGY